MRCSTILAPLRAGRPRRREWNRGAYLRQPAWAIAAPAARRAMRRSAEQGGPAFLSVRWSMAGRRRRLTGLASKPAVRWDAQAALYPLPAQRPQPAPWHRGRPHGRGGARTRRGVRCRRKRAMATYSASFNPQPAPRPRPTSRGDRDRRTQAEPVARPRAAHVRQRLRRLPPRRRRPDAARREHAARAQQQPHERAAPTTCCAPSSTACADPRAARSASRRPSAEALDRPADRRARAATCARASPQEPRMARPASAGGCRCGPRRNYAAGR